MVQARSYIADPALERNYTPWLPQNLDAAILDLGCGQGRVLRFLVERGYHNLYGIDRDGEALLAIGELPGTVLECTDVNADTLRNRPGCFNLIIMRQMIYYVDRKDILDFMVAAKEALTEDGMLLVECFNGSLLSSRMTELKDPFIRTAYTEHALRRLFAASGLYPVHIGPELRTSRSLRSVVYTMGRACWIAVLRTIYILERGIDTELPQIYSKSIISVASKRPPETIP